MTKSKVQCMVNRYDVIWTFGFWIIFCGKSEYLQLKAAIWPKLYSIHNCHRADNRSIKKTFRSFHNYSKETLYS